MKKISIMMIAFVFCMFGYGPSSMARNHPDLNVKARKFSYFINSLVHELDSSQFQQPKLHYVKHHEIIDESTGISVKGELDQYAQLSVKRKNILRKSKHNADTLICEYRLNLNGSYRGDLQVSFPIDRQYEGQPVKVQARKGNQVIHTTFTIVMNRQVRVRTHELTSFKIYLNHQKQTLSVHGWSLIICISAIILCLIFMNFLMINEAKKKQHDINKK